MALRDWIASPAAAVLAVPAVETRKEIRKTAKTATTATATQENPTTQPRPSEVFDNGRFDGTDMFQGRPTPGAVDLVEAILDVLVTEDVPVREEGIPVGEAAILDRLGGDRVVNLAILRRLAVDGTVKFLPGGRYCRPAYPPPPADLPAGCPLKSSGEVPTGCRFEPRFFRRMVENRTLPLPGGRCPMRAVCRQGGTS